MHLKASHVWLVLENNLLSLSFIRIEESRFISNILQLRRRHRIYCKTLSETESIGSIFLLFYSDAFFFLSHFPFFYLFFLKARHADVQMVLYCGRVFFNQRSAFCRFYWFQINWCTVNSILFLAQTSHHMCDWRCIVQFYVQTLVEFNQIKKKCMTE
jgi:hypothetical protein